MTTWTALTTLAGKARAEALGAALEAMTPEPTGVGVFEIEDGRDLWEVGGYFEDRPDDVALALCAAAFGAADFAVSEVPDRDWVAHVRRELSPVEAGRFFVYGAHDADKVPEGRVALRIEAAMAFGTGHHGTTLGCLRALDRLLSEGLDARCVADIGCGTAVLAMAAAHELPDAQVVASDIDGIAVDVARANLSANGLADRVVCIEAAGFDHPELAAADQFDLVFANILKGPLIELAPAMARALRPDAHAILSGLLMTQADEIAAHYASNRLKCIYRDDIVDWSTLILAKTP